MASRARRDDGAAGAQAFERAQLYEREHRIALRLQQALLPEGVVRHPSVAIATRYQAGSELMEVGGDWYDTFALEGGRIGVAVGDVVGRAIQAAASMGRLRSAMAALAAEGTAPGDLIDRLGRFASGPGQVDFATTCYALLDPATGVQRVRIRRSPTAAGREPVEGDPVARRWPLGPARLLHVRARDVRGRGRARARLASPALLRRARRAARRAPGGGARAARGRRPTGRRASRRDDLRAGAGRARRPEPR